ncbi:MAG: hypothetical protein A3B25_01730 [Candidatus Ryanbacteria bacterium RIFCSPLOWO2_01_FULL_48_26]|uniref:Protease PrsW n=1 Tax=Candidatus Ryanbacteria bacterium RIFCSPLOWO2_01_FULL_48_26 TaxID=1802126 RepID=A0A1G2GVX1_9BACT|nr:MAG: hypothetical protein A3B25_01730 [Candidatus Ryanbacteria bacterium RIFCSPLOWO2_01_FULL_48_26]
MDTQLNIDFSGPNPFTIVFSLFVGFLPGFVWLLFYLKEDMHPEPKRLIALTFVMGMASAAVALVAETVLNSGIFPVFGIVRLSVASLIIISLVEELAKFGAAYYSVNKSPYFDEPVDAMIYMVAAALGFATIENLGAITGVSTAQGAFISSIFHIASLRFVGATLLHALASACVGYFWALDIRDFKITKYLYIGLAAATVLHTIFNYLIIQYGDLMYLLIFLSIVGFFILSDFEKLKRKAI